MKLAEVIKILEENADPDVRRGMLRAGIKAGNSIGVKVPILRQVAKDHKNDHDLALKLWETGIHEARVLASMVDDPLKVTKAQIDAWVEDFDSWDLVDQCCNNLFKYTPYAYPKVFVWGKREEEYVKRAAFVMIAVLALHDKQAPDDSMEQFFSLIVQESTDDRNFVKKAVNWALRQIGKRNLSLNAKAIVVAEEIEKIDSKSARWIAKDALRELTSEKIQDRLRMKVKKVG
jgi:3-methyladenine DNA glycosylase AlkD